jgi:hypothetical protein
MGTEFWTRARGKSTSTASIATWCDHTLWTPEPRHAPGRHPQRRPAPLRQIIVERAKWKDCWEEVRYCGDRCKAEGRRAQRQQQQPAAASEGVGGAEEEEEEERPGQ